MRRALQVNASVSRAIMEPTLTADITAEITLLPAGRTSRQGPISGGFFNCPIEVAGHMHDARVFLRTPEIALGSTATVDISFLSPEVVVPRLAVGTTFKLWERGDIGHGKVVSVHRAG